MIKIENLRFSYPQSDFHLEIGAFSVKPAERVAVIGPSGSGKTTLLNLIAGIVRPENGSIIVDGTSVHTLSDTRRRAFRLTNIGFVFQDFSLLDYLTSYNNILLPYRISRALFFDAGVKERANDVARDVGVGHRLKSYPEKLSQGEKQRVAIARALLPKPKLILADEATGNLDSANKTHILDLLFQAVEKDGTTLLAVTHDQNLMKRFDRVVNFDDFQKTRGIDA